MRNVKAGNYIEEMYELENKNTIQELVNKQEVLQEKIFKPSNCLA